MNLLCLKLEPMSFIPISVYRSKPARNSERPESFELVAMVRRYNGVATIKNQRLLSWCGVESQQSRQN
jgi:hypothetical protein